MKSRRRNRVEEWDAKKGGRQYKFHILERAPTCPEAMKRFKAPLYGIPHPNADGRLSENDEEVSEIESRT